ncbi:unnamed protein product [Allacma fusca]|uniref:MD-2-related lipid-recognition domain-containing protein n=1 Tax=Allacma fusca TaxID=39272 RepID=A0A8J2KQ90_9HEXA|nr:unnamed protein product [Allacma fusca]
METSVALTLTLALALALVQGEVVSNTKCPSVKTLSNVTEVRISPCPEPGNGAESPCQLQRGSTASISIDFTPDEEISRLRASLSWMTVGLELPFPGLEPNACNSLTTGKCPLKSNSQNIWTATIKLSTAYPLGTYPLKLKITDGAIVPNVVLCEIFSVQLVDDNSWF